MTRDLQFAKDEKLKT